MVASIFILSTDTYFCSSEVELRFDRKYNTVLAKNCFGSGLTELEIVDCVIKYEASPAVTFKGCVRNIHKNGVLLSIASPLKEQGVKRILDRIACLI